MQIDLTAKEFRRLLDLVYIGNWVLNSTRGEDRFADNVFYEILAEELSRRDMDYPEITEDNYDEIVSRMDRYMSEFQLSGVQHLTLEE